MIGLGKVGSPTAAICSWHDGFNEGSCRIIIIGQWSRSGMIWYITYLKSSFTSLALIKYKQIQGVIINKTKISIDLNRKSLDRFQVASASVA